MDGVESAETSSTSGNPVPSKRPTIIRAFPRSGTTNNDEDNNQSSNSSTVDSVQQPADNSDTVIKKTPPARPSTGPSREASFEAPARPASVHLRSSELKSAPRPASVHLRNSELKSAPRPASVHLPLSQAPTVKDKPAAGKPQRKRPEITIVSARPLSEVAGFSKDTFSPSGKPTPTAAAKPTVGTPADKATTAATEAPSNVPSSHPVAAPRRGLDKDISKTTAPVDDRKIQPPGVTGGTDMSGAPPPLPTNRPKGPYIPPPLPSTRPKGSYVHPGSGPSSSVTEEKASSEATPVPKPQPRSVLADTEETPKGHAAPSRPPQPVTHNHVSDESSKLPTPRNRGLVDSEKPVFVLPPAPSSELEGASKPHITLKPPVSVEQPSQAPVVHSKTQETPQLPPKPADKPALTDPVTAPKPAEKPPLPHPVAPPKPTQQTGNTSAIAASASSDSHKPSQGPVPSKPTMPLMPHASGQKYSRTDILSLFDSTYQKNSKPESSSDAQKKVAGAVARNVSTEDALKFGSTAATVAASDKTRSGNEVSALHFASAAAQNTTKQDVNNISGGVNVLRQSEDGQKAASSFGRIAKSTASDVRSADSSSGDLKWQVASSAAKNVTADDAKNIGKAGVTLAKSEQGRKAASSIFNITRASMNQVNQTQSQNPPAPSPTARARPKNTGQQSGSSFGSLMGLMPPPKPQAVAKPSTTSVNKPAPVPKFKISAEPTAAGAQRFKPTIIRPGAEKPGSKPNSRNNSPEPKRKVPPPRPASGPQGKSKGSAPQRPNAPSGQPKSSTSSANLKPKRRAPLKPGGAPPRKSSQSESLPPRPGPGHLLYNKYMVSEPHGIALYDYKPIQPDELGFKANDVIVLLKRIDADWLRGRCGDAEGLLPAAFLKIVKDIPQTGNKPSTSEPCAVAVYSFEGAALDELRFKEGDNIVLLDRVGDQWYRGQCKGRTGIFPANHVKVIEDLPVKSLTVGSSNISGPRCTAKFDYDSTNPEDLTFKAGDVIKLVEDMGSQWLKGRLGSKTGIFPESFVDITEALPAKTSSTVMNGNSGNVVKAMFDFSAAESNEISFKAGDKITILSQVSSDWLHGELGSGLRGNLPSTFVDHIPANLPSFTADSPSEIGECIAKFDFEPAGEGELALKMGDRVTLLEYVGEDWLRGRIGSKEGIFPKTFADIVGKGGPSSGGPSLGTCKAVYDFHAEEADELNITSGDVIEILEYVSADWINGRLKGKTGKFPKAFVDIR
ncbi:sorbin and SH3 domain-containing protein 1 homolog [Patiria miniata]|uniref:SH3 domain-containing protein n=1 Tax=Patiria miniata TaxID=46514 RepID=A0A913ZZT7_PATMI|nr:sorbin and SH3 domain-containing protein 1 homolog [Patiria miniata]